jgi:hypothetical protein
MVGKLVDEGEKILENLELYVHTLRHAVVHCLSDGWYRREGDGAQGAEGNDDDFGISVARPMKTILYGSHLYVSHNGEWP